MVVVRVVVFRELVVQTQNFPSPAARGSGPRDSGTNAKFSKIQPRVVVLRTQNILSPAARGSGTSSSGTNLKFS